MAHGFYLFLLFSYIISTNIHACKQTEHSSLLSFASTLSSPPLNWTSRDCCHWKGINCDQDGWVTRLLLPSKGLKGGISPFSLGNLTHLTHLNLSHNSLFGSLEIQFFLSLNRLEILDLSYNCIFGDNNFFGAIPSSFFQQASNLTSFNVSNNTFTGLLDFSSNVFNDNLAPGLGKCSKLQVFRAGHNNLSGLLPEDIYNVTKLEEIALPLNSLDGAISDKIVTLANLSILDLSFNHFGGELPLHLGKLSKLKFVTLDFNNLEGSLPPSLMKCTNVVELRLASNNLEGDISMFDFSRLSSLTKLDLRINNFTGTVPLSLYSCRSSKAIELSGNHLKGQIQAKILSLKSLSFHSLGYNQFTNLTWAMKILMSCKSLHALSLAVSFEGEVMPFDDDMVDFDEFENLRVLSLANSNFTGTLPRLLSLNLASNRISSEIPKQLCRLPRLVVYEPIASQVDQYEFELPAIHAATNHILPTQKLSFYPAMIDLSNNNIVGSLPTEIDQLHLLRQLDLHANKFSGIIPDQISNLKNLEVLDLSMNHLSGNILLSLASLNFLKEFNVSYNNLEGPIPTSTQIQTFNAAFEGNLKLCGAPLPNKCKPNKGIDEDNKNNKDMVSGSTILSSLGPPLCPHGFVFGSSRATSQWVTHPGIALAPNSLNFGVPTTPKPLMWDLTSGLHQLPWFYIFVALGFIVGFWGLCSSLVVNKTWRYAYFRFVDNVQDRLYLMVSPNMFMDAKNHISKARRATSKSSKATLLPNLKGPSPNFSKLEINPVEFPTSPQCRAHLLKTETFC
ncbi:hypothetical protein PRUPE_4G163000 [Prunus persica]|uniref:Leucine-rich repeat-containing N-terminal plant-type domain-containing protein n=1 Tax=Prunus persica TaxID=3760 RepID=A0A251PLF7_PRUPE|nr:hypothetical protein PRUPE_4G163000 [Prunus persica]